MPLETEVKISLRSIDAVRRRLRYLGYRVHARRIFESNIVFDSSDRKLRASGVVLRVRRAGHNSLLTYKAGAKPGRYKSREEIETTVANGGALEEILTRLGYTIAFRYEKYRTEYMRNGERGAITVDETPIGNYLEIEGAGKFIDEAARELGFSQSDFITKSYGALYLDYCRDRGITPTNMVFGGTPERRQ